MSLYRLGGKQPVTNFYDFAASQYSGGVIQPEPVRNMPEPPRQTEPPREKAFFEQVFRTPPEQELARSDNNEPRTTPMKSTSDSTPDPASDSALIARTSPSDEKPTVTNNVVVDPTITVAPKVYDAALSNNQGVILKILFNALVSGSLAYVLSEDSVYYAALGGIISAIKRQVAPDVTFAENDNASDANINNWNLFYEGATIGGGVGVSYYLKNSNPIKSAIILGVSRYSSELLP